MGLTAEQRTCPQWHKAYQCPTIQSIADFCNGFDLEYEGIDLRQEEFNQFWFLWSGEIPRSGVRVKFAGLDSDKPTCIMINAIVSHSRMPATLKLDLEENLDPDQLETALGQIALIVNFG